jgi:signal transduction histidine kinase
MLCDFLTSKRDELVARCRSKAAARRAPRPTEAELEYGIPHFVQQLIDTLQSDPSLISASPTEAERDDAELLDQGYTLARVIHDYLDLGQSIRELAAEAGLVILPEELRTLNNHLDDSVARAVSDYAKQRERVLEEEAANSVDVRLGVLAHEMRNLLGTATLSFEMIKRGNVSVDGATSKIHGRALRGLSTLIDRSLAEVRLSIGVHKERIQLLQFIEEVEVTALLEAQELSIRFNVLPVDRELVVDADRQILAAILANLLQNAFKFTRENGHRDVSLFVHKVGDKVHFDVEDECGGLPTGAIDELFRPFEQRGSDRSGLGLGLTISRQGVEANDGTLHVRDVPGHGCVFSVELPAQPAHLN